jgi:LuxR family transcriptional regulator/LuxR family quorum-sensing system transcriptional regulator CciR
MKLSTYIDEVSACTSVDGLKRLLISSTTEFGAAAIAGYAFPFGDDVANGRQAPIVTTYPEAVSDAYRELMAQNDPVMAAAMALGAPIHFLRIESSLHFSARAQFVLQIMRDHGLQDAVATPVFERSTTCGYFSMAFPAKRPDLSPADLRRIKFIFSEFYSRFIDVSRLHANILSQREREVMVAIVNNRTNAEIAGDLGVSEHTVETYVRRCFTKLEVSNRMQAALRFLGATGTPMHS